MIPQMTTGRTLLTGVAGEQSAEELMVIPLRALSIRGGADGFESSKWWFFMPSF